MTMIDLGGANKCFVSSGFRFVRFNRHAKSEMRFRVFYVAVKEF